MDKTELLAKIRACHAELETLLAQLSEAQLTQAGAQDDWSVKDIVAHIAVWQSLAMGWAEQGARGETVDRPVNWSDDQLNNFNQRLHEQHKDRALADVLADLRNAHQKMLAMVESLSDKDINDPNRFAWREGSPLLNLIAGNTFGHYPEHIEAIHRWMEKSKRLS